MKRYDQWERIWGDRYARRDFTTNEFAGWQETAGHGSAATKEATWSLMGTWPPPRTTVLAWYVFCWFPRETWQNSIGWLAC